ncbi:CAP domain-containing protein [Cytophagaceae bacterium YF14B1]|uniref:CAP domain-containing protein n=2 Tax=Xanthocytophaga flava TaxID=3048013 RepID=A0AAE3UCF9_9BACT|nr:CAP domain-containing protein [Xanthocytophaga flavus]
MIEVIYMLSLNYYFTITFLLYLLLSPIHTKAQTPFDPIHRSSINIKYLEFLVKTQVDSVRRTKGLSPLISDSIAYLAAQDQGEYLKNKPSIGHYQSSANKKTPQDRVNFYGASNYLTGENVLSYPLENTYIETARKMVKGWVNSPGHYKNIITPSYQITGVAIVPHQKNGNLIAVQVFAKVLFKYTFETNKSLFPYDTIRAHIEKHTQNKYDITNKKEKLPWKLKPIKNEITQSSELAKAVFKDQLDLRPSYRSNEIFLYSSTPEALKKLVKRRKDGITIEFIDYEPYHCGNPAYYTASSRRNNNSSISGQIVKPVYRKTLLSDLKKQKQVFKKEKRKKLKPLRFQFSAAARQKKKIIRTTRWQPDETTIKLGEWSQADSGMYLIPNFLLIHKKRILTPIYFSDACGDFLFTDMVHVETNFLTPHFTTFAPEEKSFDFKVPFTRNNTYPDSLKMIAIRDTLLNYQIDSIQITAFASVEGLNELNEKLYHTRGENILAYIKQYTNQKTHIQIKTGENWPLFYTQLRVTDFEFWKTCTRIDIKQELQKPAVLTIWEKNLNEQRNAHVYVKAHVLVRDTLVYLQKYQKREDFREATNIQNYYYQLWQQHRLPTDSLLWAVNYPNRKEYSNLIANTLAFEYLIYGNNGRLAPKNRDRQWKIIKASLSMKGITPELRYYAICFMLNNTSYIMGQGYGAEKILKQIRYLSTNNAYKTRAQKLTILYYLHMIPEYARRGQRKQVTEGAKIIYRYYQNKPEIVNSRDKSLTLANFFIHIMQEEYAVNILMDYLSQTGFDGLIYSQFLKIAFVHPDYQVNRAYTQLLIEAKKKLTQVQWCDLFVGECCINFQIFDDEELRNLYCESCAELGNEATRKANSKTK